MATKSVRTPIIARQVWFNQKVEREAAETRQAAERVEDLARCRELYPAAFDMDRPLALTCGVHKALAPLLGTKRAHRLLAWWVHSPLYAAAIAAGGHRFTLDGQVAEAISDAHRQKAQVWIEASRKAA